ncbi:MAG: DnaA/Hda family protein [Planctomycetia bacterium]|nr:DnaA/Hda family protein [Planctomycetia bacterium]
MTKASPAEQINSLFHEALRAKLGEQRYSMWFADGTRFVLSEKEVCVWIAREFQFNWIQSSYRHVIEQLSRELLGRDVQVRFICDDPNVNANVQAPRTTSRTTNDASADVVPFAVASLNSANAYNPSSVARQTLLLEEPVATPVKRKRGRPRKNPQAIASPATGSAPVNQSLHARNNSPVNVVSFTAANGATTSPTSTTDVAPPKRKRGRPRKDTVPTDATTATLLPSVNDAKTQLPLDPPTSFSDQFNFALNQLESAGAPLASVAQPLNLSDAERVAWRVGDFNETSDATAPTVAPTRGKRGRPKGSGTRANADANAAPIVIRDANGLNVVPASNAPKRARAATNSQRVYASLQTFVEGPTNLLARRVVELSLAQLGAMNPIFVCGPTSVGKTHLLEGACDALMRRNALATTAATQRPLYMTAEQFTTSFIQSLRGQGAAFRDQFKNISLFALDDVHFLEGKLSTQTELLNVYDYLRSRGVQMIFSANRPLAELSKLRSELTTRIESGVVCKIENAQRETLAQIFRQMALERRLNIPDDVARYVASRFTTHARQLSGALNRLYAMHLAVGSPITLEFARDALADLATPNLHNIKLEDVERVVEEIFGLDDNALKSSSRAKKYADPRALAMWLARKHTRSGLTEIGAYFGGRRHSSVLAAAKKVDAWLESNQIIATLNADYPLSDTIKRIENALLSIQS